MKINKKLQNKVSTVSDQNGCTLELETVFVGNCFFPSLPFLCYPCWPFLCCQDTEISEVTEENEEHTEDNEEAVADSIEESTVNQQVVFTISFFFLNFFVQSFSLLLIKSIALHFSHWTASPETLYFVFGEGESI